MMYQYDEHELDAAVDYISTYNPHKFSKTKVRASIMDTINKYYSKEDVSFAGTMGYKVQFTQDYPDVVDVRILVSPNFKSEGKYVTVDADGKIVKVEYVE